MTATDKTVLAGPGPGPGTGKGRKPVSGIYSVNTNAAVVPGKVIVKWNAHLSKQGADAWERSLSEIHARSAERLFPHHAHRATPLSAIYRIDLPPESEPCETAVRLMQNPDVEWAEPVYVRKLCYDPDDPAIGSQWQLEKIQCALAWDLFKGDTSIVIGIIDSGVELDHPDLMANIWINPGEIPGNGVDDDHNEYIDDVYGWDFGEQDNDPNPSRIVSPPWPYHGTSVAGAASGVTDNGTGIAAPAFNARIMAVKTTEDDDPEQQPNYGYLGIEYAAENGADIINCSFGGEGASNAERTVIEYAVSRGVIVIGSAGNEGRYGSVYPAAYPSVLSVASIGRTDLKSSFSNYGPDVDISGPGESIYTTSGNHGYTTISGTSFSAPVTAGVTALVMGYHPDWEPEQVRQQVRISALPIDALNPAYQGDLGWGRLDAYRSLTVSSPAIRLVRTVITESAGANMNGIMEPGETVDVIFTLQNYLAPTDPVHVVFSASESGVAIQTPQFDVPALGTMEQYSNASAPLQIHLDSQVDRGLNVDVQVLIQAGSYTDRDHFSFEIAPDYADFSTGQVQLTLSSTGRLGYVDYPDNEKGSGFLFGPENLLFEGALMVAVGPDSVSDVARDATGDFSNTDFKTAGSGELAIMEPGLAADAEATARFDDMDAGNSLHVDILHKSYAFQNAPDNAYILTAFILTAESPHSACYAGLFMDWDVGNNGLNSGSNLPGFDSDLNLAYIYDPQTQLYGGLQVFPGVWPVQYRELNNPDDIYDGFSDNEKWNCLSHGLQRLTDPLPDDYSHVLGTGPFAVSGQDTVYIGFALLGCEGYEDLRSIARAARDKWQNLISNGMVPVPDRPPDTSFILFPGRPNPFVTETQIYYKIPETESVKISVHDILGRTIATLINGRVVVDSGNPFPHVMWNGRTSRGSMAAAGVYFIVLEYRIYRKVQKVLFLGAK
ncbi:S8 family serine peptidase [bacterium]|nr:S8 family serine peptidase [bacterium]